MSSAYCWAQTVINGSVFDDQGKTITSGYIITKNRLQDKNVVEYSTVNDGKFKILLSKVYVDSIYVIAQIPGYSKEFKGFRTNEILERTTNIIFDLKTVVESLDKIVIKRKLPEKVIVKKDTLSYDISQITNVEDRKLKDVINKIPQLDYNESTGVIKYKNVEIKTITINGTNIVDGNYSIIAKNLKLDMIDRLETIDNYNDNPITAEFSSSNDKSLNLVLKKSAIQFSLGLEGILGSYDFDKAAVGLSLSPSVFNEKINSFNFINGNNIGINPSTIEINNITDQFHDPFYNTNIESLFNSNFSNSNGFDNNRSVVNETFYASANNNFKLSKNTELKLNIDYLEDQNVIERKNITRFNLETPIENILDASTIYRPEFLNSRIDFRTIINKKSLLDVEFGIQKNNHDRVSAIERNNTESFKLSENQTFRNFYSKANYSKKINSLNALEISFFGEIQKNEQKFNGSPSFLTVNTISGNDYQDYDLSQTRINLSGIHYYKNKNNQLINTINFFQKNDVLQSQLNINNSIQLFSNSLDLNNTTISFSNQYLYKKNKLSLRLFSQLDFIDQALIDESELNNSSIEFIPSARISYRFNKALLFFNIERTIKTLNTNTAFSNNLLSSENSIITNIPSLNLIKGINLNLGYIYLSEDPLSKSAQIFANYSRTNALFMNSADINDTFLSSVNRFVKANTNNYQLNGSYSYFFESSKINVKTSPYIQYSNAPVSLNSDLISEINSFSAGANLSLTTTFSSFFNFNSNTRFNHAKSSINRNNISFSGFKQQLGVRIKSSKDTWLKIDYNLEIPNINNSDQFQFLDAEFSFKAYKSVKTSLVGRNLFNLTTITTNNIDAFSEVISVQNTLPRYVGLRFEFDF